MTTFRKRLGLALATLVILPAFLFGGTLRVGEGEEFQTIESAAAVARPGDTILIVAVQISYRSRITDLHGAPGRPIVLRGESEGTRFVGGTQALHLSQVSWLVIEGLEFTGQTENGVNIDDGSTLETPSHNVLIDRCTFSRLDATGNNDLLKLSGLDTFAITNSLFLDGAAGGSGIDMVGCHVGSIEGNRFERMGSNGIQAKGGTRYIQILRNRFVECGERSVNLGGSTGLPFFRPQDAPFEAADLLVQANTFIGSRAPIAYVGSTRVLVQNNTIWRPGNWVLRILQETVDPERFIACGDSRFVNNLVVVDGDLSRLANIGPDTRPESFGFEHNIFVSLDDPEFEISGLPGLLQGNMVAPEARLSDTIDFSPEQTSPVLGRGLELPPGTRDLLGTLYSRPPSVGAVEGDPDRSDVRQPEMRDYLEILDLAEETTW